jgi:AcrR family transcriptional regulator
MTPDAAARDTTAPDATVGNTARQPAGAAVPSQRVTDAIRRATFDVLAETGYGRLSIEAIAKRAGVSKTAIYRRWPSKQDLVLDLVTQVAVQAIPVPDTGSFYQDLLAYLREGHEVITHPLVRVIAPDLLAEAARNPELAKAFITQVRDPRRERAAGMIQRAIGRGEIPPDTDIDCAMDFLGGPLYWRVAVRRIPVDDAYIERVARGIHTAITSGFR